MKSFLKRRWLGPLILILYVVSLSFAFSSQFKPVLKKTFSAIAQEAIEFLPITIQKGEIVQPVNQVIAKTYSEDGKKFHIMLDTREDVLDVNTLPGNGIYVSRKCVYAVSSEETKIQCFNPEQMPDQLVITEETVKILLDQADKYVLGFLSFLLIGILMIYFYGAILVYTIIMHWLVASFFKVPFGQIFFVNTLAYTILSLLEISTSLQVVFWLKLILFIGVNIAVCKSANERKHKTQS